MLIYCRECERVTEHIQYRGDFLGAPVAAPQHTEGCSLLHQSHPDTVTISRTALAMFGKDAWSQAEGDTLVDAIQSALRYWDNRLEFFQRHRAEERLIELAGGKPPKVLLGKEDLRDLPHWSVALAAECEDLIQDYH